MDNVYKNIEEYKPNKKQKVLIVFDDMIADMLTKKKLNPMVTRLFTRANLSVSLVFITQSDFPVPRNIRLNSTQNFFLKIPNKRELQKMHLIIHQTLTFTAIWILIKSVL